MASSSNSNLLLLDIKDPEHALKAPSELPVPEHDIASVSCGKECLSIVTQDGTVFTSKVKDGDDMDWKQPSGLSQHHVISVQSGSRHHVALTTDRQLLAWGKNDWGQLGRGKNGSRDDTKRKKTNTASGKRGMFFNASLIPSIQNVKIHQVSCGNSHNMCLSENGQVYTWGANDCGQLGLRRDDRIGTPDFSSYRSVPHLVSDLQHFHIVQIAAGGRHSVVVSASGVVYCWGSNLYGQLGLSLRVKSDGKNFNHRQTMQWSPFKCQAVAMEKVREISCGENHTAFLTWTGCVLTCGMGSSGQLGHSSMDNEFLPRRITGELDGKLVTNIACGRNYTTAHVKLTNTIYVLGAGKRKETNLPERLDNPIILCGEQFLFIYQPSSFSGEDEEEEMENSCSSGTSVKSPLLTLDVVWDNIKNKKTSLNHHDKSIINNLLERALSQAACVNGSFITNKGEKNSEFKHDVDLEAADNFFKEITKVSFCKVAEKALKKLLKNPHLNKSSKIESLRLYVFLPCCLYRDGTVFCDDIVTSLAEILIGLSDNLKLTLGKWLANISAGFFKRYVLLFMKFVTTCINKVRTPPIKQSKLSEIRRSIEVCVQVLDFLNEINECRSDPVPYDTFYIEDLIDDINIQFDYIAKVQDVENKNQSSFRFCKYPFLFNSAAKQVLLWIQCTHLMGYREVRLLWFTFRNINTLSLTVRREHVVEDTREWFSTNEDSLHSRLDVMFKDENTSSGDGIRQEFFQVLLENLLSEQFGCFFYEDKSNMQWFKEGSNLEDLYFLGLMCGLALYQGFTLHLQFPCVLYKKLLNKPVVFSDLRSLNPDKHKCLMSILDYPDDDIEDVFCLDFANPVELCPGGADIPVTQNNKEDYVNKLTDYYLNTSIETEFESFRKGFFKSMPEDLLSNFHPKELEEILVGNERYDFKALEKNVGYLGSYHKDHKTIKLFWKVFHEMKLDDQKNFLKYLTGTDRIPAYGMNRMLMRIIPREVPGEDPDYLLLHAETCTNTLKLPEYTSKGMLEEKLLMAISHFTEFGLD